MKTTLLIVARVLLITAIICTLSFAFYQSTLPPAESNEVSDGVSGILVKIIPPETLLGAIIHENIRTIAHFCEFFALGIFTSLYCVLVSTAEIGVSKTKLIFVIVSLIFGSVCALIDESIQFFSSRAPDIIDGIVDTSGYVSAIFAVYTVYFAIFLVLNLIARQRGKHRA